MKTELKALEEKYSRIQSIMRFVNEETLREAYEKQPNSDVKQMYGEHLDENIRELLRRMKISSYFPQSSDRGCLTNVDMDNKIYILKAFEDRLLQCLFKEILDAIFKSKIHHKMADLKKNTSTIESRKAIIIIAMTKFVLEIDVVRFLRKIDQKSLADFLKQSVADKVFTKYCERFLRSGMKLLDGCVDLEGESAICFISMMCSTCGYYILQSLNSSILEDDLSGAIWEAYGDNNVKIMFEKSRDCKIICCQLNHEMKKRGINMIGDQICTIRPFVNVRKRFPKDAFSLRNRVRLSKNRIDRRTDKVK